MRRIAEGDLVLDDDMRHYVELGVLAHGEMGWAMREAFTRLKDEGLDRARSIFMPIPGAGQGYPYRCARPGLPIVGPVVCPKQIGPYARDSPAPRLPVKRKSPPASQLSP
jgi:hypothetical protein